MDKTTQLRKKFNRGNFKTGASKFKLKAWYFTNLLFFQSGWIPFSCVLVNLLRLYGAKIGRGVRIKPGIRIKYPWKLEVGDHCWLANCYIENLDTVKIGHHVCISQEAMLLTGNHNYNAENFDLITKTILLEEGVWIAARAIVCPGVKAGTHAVLTCGAIANKDLEKYTIYQGNPARPLRLRSIS